MRLYIVLLFILLLLPLSTSRGFLPFFKRALKFVTGGGPLVEIGLTTNNVVQLKKADPNSKLAVDMLKSLGEAFENHETIFDNRMNKLQSGVNSQLELTKDLIQKFEIQEQTFDHRMNELHSTVTLQFFQEKVNYPAHNLFMTATKYVKNPNRIMERHLLNECLKHTPYTRLNDLNTMISDKWFLIQTRNANYRLPDVESIRMHVYNVMKELLLSHFICMAIQDEPVEDSPITETVRSAVTNIIDIIDKELKTIENSFFPKYVVKEVKKLIGATTFPENEIKQRIAMAETTLKMLRNFYGPGIIVDSKNRSLFVRDYEVQVGKRQAYGKMPEEAIVEIKVKDYYILVIRADRFGVSSDINMESYSRRLTIEDDGIACNIKIPIPELLAEDVFALTWIKSDDNVIKRPQKSTDARIKCPRITLWQKAITAACLDPPIELSFSEFELKTKEELVEVQDLRNAIQAELVAIEMGKSDCASFTSRRFITLACLVIYWTFDLVLLNY